MSDKIFKKGTCTFCGLHQNCLIEDMEDLYSFWKCIYCDEEHSIRKIKRFANAGGEK